MFPVSFPVFITHDKYLCDIVSEEMNTMNIKERKSKGIGLLSQILALLEEVSLGVFYFEIAILLRETMLINGILGNAYAEVWYGLTKANISELEDVDKMFLRRILNAHSKTPIESYYLELQCTPIRYMIMGRRIMFLHYIMGREEDDLVN